MESRMCWKTACLLDCKSVIGEWHFSVCRLSSNSPVRRGQVLGCGGWRPLVYLAPQRRVSAQSGYRRGRNGCFHLQSHFLPRRKQQPSGLQASSVWAAGPCYEELLSLNQISDTRVREQHGRPGKTQKNTWIIDEEADWGLLLWQCRGSSCCGIKRLTLTLERSLLHTAGRGGLREINGSAESI